VGIFGQICDLEKILNAGDRIEIYRPLQKDPMDARRQKAKIKR
jgi:putative ubiquitin-RnfH superfamily antitoxin RatB of RatAB toxin-antitoxin module